MAVVSIPAYPEAKALAMVAEIEEDNRRQTMLAHTDYEISEVDFETIRCWFFDMLRATLGDELWDYRIERICVDCAILYDVRHGRTLKFEYVAGDEGLVVTDVYEVMYQRIENNGGKEMSETMNKELEAQAAVANAQAVEAKTMLTQAQATITTLNTQVQEQGDRITELQDENTTLQEQADAVPSLQAEVEKLRGQIAEIEAESKRDQLRQFANAHHLDMENETVTKAIAELDAITLMAESAKLATTQDKPVLAPHAFSAGLQSEPYGGLLGNE